MKGMRVGLGSGFGFALRLALLWLAAAVCGTAASAVPTAQVSIGGGAPIDIALEQDGKIFFTSGQTINGPDWTVTINSLVFDPDPSIVYGVSVLNNTGGFLSFAFLFSQSITLTPTPGVVNTSIQGGTTNAGSSGSVTINPLAPPLGIPVDSDGNTEIHVFNLSNANDGGATLTNAELDLGPSFTSTVHPSDSYPAINSPEIAGPLNTGNYDFMRLDVNFEVTGGGDRATLSGSARVVPEPATAVLIALGLLGIGYVGRPRA